jgi:hypothetical protein
VENDHERLIARLCGASLGAPFVFAPDRWSKSEKGPRNLEPADIAWFGNGVVVLMHLYRGKSSAEKALKHNLKNFKGWIKAWRGGRRLTGSNSFQSFDIGWDDFDHVILLSVVDGPGAQVAVHRHEAVEMDAAFVGSVPHEFVQWLADHRASHRDLMELLRWMSREGTAPPVDDLLGMSARMEQTARQISGLELLLTAPTIGTVDEIAQYLIGMRWAPVESNGSSIPYRLLELLSDLSWRDLYVLLAQATVLVQQIRAVPAGETGPLSGFAVLELRPYTVSLAVMGQAQFETANEMMVENIRRADALARPGYPSWSLNILVIASDLLAPSFSVSPQSRDPGRSVVAQIADALAARSRRGDVASSR